MLPGLGSSHFARRYYGNRFFFLFLRVLRCFSSPGSLIHIMNSCECDKSSTCRVSPFGYQGIYACLRLPLAFRSLPRPSSALGALASTLCSSSLDYVDPETRYIYFRLLSNLFFATGLSRLFLVFLPCAVVKVRSKVTLGKWVAVDSNHRPLAYQASALTD